MMRKQWLWLLPVLASGGCMKFEGGEHINGAVSVAAGQPAADATTVNGAIHIAADAAVKKAETVNGSIAIGDRAAVESAETVNGAITVGAGARVGGDVTTVNGAIMVRRDAAVKGKLDNVNGAIVLDSARVGGDIETVGGDITIGAGSRVEGGIRVQGSSGFSISFTKRVPVVVIEPGAVVRGPLKFEREVRLLVSERATIGPVSGATPESFAGEHPPG